MNICFTGHRPNKLGGYDLGSPKNKIIISNLNKQIIDLLEKYDDEPIHFICGGALGIDQIAFELCRRCRDHSNKYNITIELAIPFKKQDCRWNYEAREIYKQQILDANVVTYVDEIHEYNIELLEVGEYFNSKMDSRNRYMVDNSHVVVAVWDGSKGGTGNCIKYATRKDKTIIRILP